jgi:hypothetical protein
MAERVTASLLFGFREGVTRATYSKVGVGLFALKYAVDLALSLAFAANAHISIRCCHSGSQPWGRIQTGCPA